MVVSKNKRRAVIPAFVVKFVHAGPRSLGVGVKFVQHRIVNRVTEAAVYRHVNDSRVLLLLVESLAAAK